MSILLGLSLRGSVTFLIVLASTRFSHRSMQARGRRIWWCLVALAYLVPIQLAVFPPARAVSGIRASGPLNHGAASSASTVFSSAAFAPVINYVAWSWLAVAIAYFAALAAGTVGVARRWSRAGSSSDPELLEIVKDCKRQLGIRIRVGLVVSPGVATPAILGWFRPRILLPAGLVSTLARRELRAVLLHELAHCRAGDVPLNWLFAAARALHWFNPLAHLAPREWSRFREEAADETAARSLAEPSAETYLRALILTLRQTHGETAPFGAVGMGESYQDLRGRIQRIKRLAGRRPRLVAALAVSALLFAGTFVRRVRPTVDARPGITCPVASLLTQHLQTQ